MYKIDQKIKIKINNFFIKIKKDKYQDIDKMERFIRNHIFTNDSLLLIKYILHNKEISKNLKEHFTSRTLSFAASENKKEIYEYIIKGNYFNFNNKVFFHNSCEVLKKFLLNENIEMIRYIFNNYKKLNINEAYPIIFNYFYYPHPTNKQIIYFIENNLDILNKEILFYNCLVSADLEILKYLYSKGIFFKFKEIGSYLSPGGVEYLKWVYSIDKEIFFDSEYRRYFFIPRYGFYKNLKVFDFIFEIKKVTEDELLRFIKTKPCITLEFNITQDFKILKYLARKVNFSNEDNYIKFLCKRDKDNLITTEIIKNYKGKSNNIKHVLKSSIRAAIKTKNLEINIDNYINFARENKLITKNEIKDIYKRLDK